MFAIPDAPSAKQQDCGQHLCKPCYILFPSQDALFQHKLAMRAAGEPAHVCCKICGQDFHNEKLERQHMHELHARDQDLYCPGCAEGPFSRLAPLMHHIEVGECSGLTGNGLDELRSRKLQFTRSLRSLTNESVKLDYSAFVDPYHRFKTQISGAPQGSSDRAEEENAAPAHPHESGFSARRYYCVYSEKYNCPVRSCTKTFRKAQALVNHLNSPAHGNKVYRCPYCCTDFKSLQSITSHVESSGVRCHIRDTDEFGAFIDQLTAGLVDVLKERHDDDSPKFAVQKSAREKIEAFKREKNGL